MRTKKGVSLSSAGETILPAIKEYLFQESCIYELAGEINGLNTGRITIASYASIAAHWLPEVIKEFQEKYPQIEINLMVGICQEVSQWLDERIADIGFFSYKEPMSYEWISLADDPMLAVLPVNHLSISPWGLPFLL